MGDDMIPSDAEVVPVEGVFRTGKSCHLWNSLGRGQGYDLIVLQATTRKSETAQYWWLEQRVELVVKLFSVSAMKASECVPWCETTQKWYDLLTFLSARHEHLCVAGQHLMYLLPQLALFCNTECCALQNSGMYSQNVEVVKGDVYQYMTLPAAMQGWYDNHCKLTAS